MKPLPEKCENSNTVASFCDCMSGEAEIDVAAAGFCKRAAENGTGVTGDDLVELKKALKDLNEPESEEGCCEC